MGRAGDPGSRSIILTVGLFKGGGDIPLKKCVLKRVGLVLATLTQKYFCIRSSLLVILIKHLDPIIYVIGYVDLARRVHGYPER